MGLKCMLVKLGRRGDIVLLVTPKEETLWMAALAENPGFGEVMVSAALSRQTSLPSDVVSEQRELVEQEVSEIKRLLDGASSLVVSSDLDAANLHQIAEAACEAHLRGVRVTSFETALLELDPSVPAHAGSLLQRLAACGTHQSLTVRTYAAIKDTFEPVLAALLLFVLSPLVILLAVLVRVTSPGPVFYRQTRLGHNRQLFDIIKFRSMRTDAEKDGPMWAAASKTDARLTPIGGFLRATHLDEIPQIWNVVRGELSFVGPRPERPVFCQEIEREIPLFRLRTLVKPGITGWAQVRAGYANSIDDSKRKLEFDLFYILKHSPQLDARVVLDTLSVLVRGGSEGRKRERFALGQANVEMPGLTTRPYAVTNQSEAAARAEIS